MSVVRVVLLSLLSCSALHGQKVAELRARTGKPVIQELLGGCSLTCAFPWQAFAGSSNSVTNVSVLNDADSFTAWTTAQIGDRVVFKFPPDLPRELNGTPFYGIDVANGRLHPEGSFHDFGRVKTLRLLHNGHALYVIHLVDTRRWQHVTFPDVYLNVGDTLGLEVVETYPGRTQRSVAISEIVLQGAH